MSDSNDRGNNLETEDNFNHATETNFQENHTQVSSTNDQTDNEYPSAPPYVLYESTAPTPADAPPPYPPDHVPSIGWSPEVTFFNNNGILIAHYSMPIPIIPNGNANDNVESEHLPLPETYFDIQNSCNPLPSRNIPIQRRNQVHSVSRTWSRDCYKIITSLSIITIFITIVVTIINLTSPRVSENYSDTNDETFFNQ